MPDSPDSAAAAKQAAAGQAGKKPLLLLGLLVVLLLALVAVFIGLVFLTTSGSTPASQELGIGQDELDRGGEGPVTVTPTEQRPTQQQQEQSKKTSTAGTSTERPSTSTTASEAKSTTTEGEAMVVVPSNEQEQLVEYTTTTATTKTAASTTAGSISETATAAAKEDEEGASAATTATGDTLFVPAQLPAVFADVDALVQKCSASRAAVKKQCPAVAVASGDDSPARVRAPSESDAASSGHFGGLLPVHYSVNWTLHTLHPARFEASVRLYAHVQEATSRVSLHVGAQLHRSGAVFRDCERGFELCVTSEHYDRETEVLTLELESALPKGVTVELEFTDIQGLDRSGALFSLPSRRKDQPAMTGSLFQMRSARAMMPCIDAPVFKTTFDLCLRAPVPQARANTAPKSGGVKQDRSMTETCFERTPLLPTYLLAFALFDRINPVLYDSSLPAIEIVAAPASRAATVNPRETYAWIESELRRTLALMANWSGVQYPLDKLTVLVAPTPIYGIENFGLIAVQDAIVQRPQLHVAHTTVVHEAVHQWVGDLFTVASWNEICLQESLTTYLEWRVSERLNSTGRSRVDQFSDQRHALLEGRLETPAAYIAPYRSLADITRACFELPPCAWYTLDVLYPDSAVRFLRAMSTKFAFRSAALPQWTETLAEVTDSQAAARFFTAFFTRPIAERPILVVRVEGQTATIEQVHHEKDGEGQQQPWTVPIGLQLADEKRLLELETSSHAVLLNPDGNRFILLDPDYVSTFLVVYDADTYLRLIECLGRPQCHGIPKARLHHVFADLLAAVRSARLPHTTLGDPATWRSVLSFIDDQISGISERASCCVRHALGRPSGPSCMWTIEDDCRQMPLIELVRASSVTATSTATATTPARRARKMRWRRA